MTKRKRMCRKCNRRMVVEHEMYEECTNSECAYYYSYEVPEMTEEDEANFAAYLEVVRGK